MAGEFDWLQSSAATAGSSIYNLITWLLVLALIGGLVWFIIWFMSYKHKVVIRMITKNGKYVIEDKAKVMNDKGTPIWRLLKQKKDVKPPPPEAIEISAKGKYFAEAYWSEDNPSPAWLTDKGTPEDSFSKQAFTSTERAFYTARHQKALERKTESLWNKISQIIMPVSLIVIIMIPFMFWGDITKQSTETITQVQKMGEQNARISEQNARILSVLAGKLESGEIEVIQDLPPPDVPINETLMR